MQHIQKLGLAFNLVNLSCYVLLIVSSIINIFYYGQFANTVTYLFISAICFLLFSIEIHRPIYATEYFKFAQTYLGRGILFEL